MKHFITSAIVLALLLSCSHIDESERLIEVAIDDTPTPGDTLLPEEIVRHVLLEDFTGQRCVNCPNGAVIISQLEEAYGERFIPVGIYWEPIPVPNGLATETGKEYYSHWSIEGQPAGRVDRQGAIRYSPNNWIADVAEALKRPANVAMQLDATLNGQQIDINVMETCPQNPVSGSLQVWIVEDSITATQLMPNGPAKRDYVHNHAFRTAVNGSWGDPVTVAVGDTLRQSYQQTVSSQWNTAQLSVVAFVYNDQGVEQVAKSQVNRTQEQ